MCKRGNKTNEGTKSNNGNRGNMGNNNNRGKRPSIIFSLYASVQRVLYFLTPSLLHKAYCINVDTMYSIYMIIIHHFISVHVI